jgi:hypothetical protein
MTKCKDAESELYLTFVSKSQKYTALPSDLTSRINLAKNPVVTICTIYFNKK